MSIYNEPKDLELCHYGRRGMRWGQHKKWSDLLNSDVKTIKEQEPIVNDYINKVIKSGSIASALGVGKYDDGISTSRSLNSLSKTSDRTLPYSDYYFHPADRVSGKSVARTITSEKKYKKYGHF